jgi:serine/threonine protein phosphatase PrpC
MAVRTSLRWAAASDRGIRRSTNEDRYYADPARGIFVVIDGVGGHSAGEHAAEIARDVVRERLERATGTPEQRLREAIALANNEIWRQSRACPEWRGMACVLTAAIVEDDIVSVGHVGDSRLYLLRPGEVRKITRDHSPVGEREDRGDLSEAEAMRHERRNEIYRDVGSSSVRNPDESNFVDLEQFPMPVDGALLLCSDGLTDQITSGEIRAYMERNAADLDGAAAALIAAANGAGGKDNVTVVLVAGPEYRAAEVARETVAGETAPDPVPQLRHIPRWLAPSLWGLVLGLAIGVLAWPLLVTRASPRTIIVDAAGIGAALDRAHPGDTVEIPPGLYRERIELRQGVTIRAQRPGVTISSPDGGPAVVARSVTGAALDGIWIQGDAASPPSAGLEIVDASPVVSNIRISGAGTGIEIRGRSEPAISGSQIVGNPGAGIEIREGSGAKITNNLIAANGKGKPGPPMPGVEVHPQAHPILRDNGIVDNAAEPIRLHGAESQRADYAANFFGPMDVEDAVLIDPPSGRP